jgi:tetratricopeptide (TPR) repeat protein
VARGLRNTVTAILAVTCRCRHRPHQPLLTWQQLGYWQDNISLYRHTLQITTGNYLKLITTWESPLSDKGDLDAAIREFQAAIGINPNYANAHYNLGNAFCRTRNMDAAIQEFQEAIRINPNNADAHYNLGAALASQGNLDAAIQEYQEAIRLNPIDAMAHINLGAAFASRGNLDAAIQEFQEGLRINPNDLKAQTNLGIAIAQRKMKNQTVK